ncbi:Tryptophan synthase alpha chain [bioreactor metagenome]|jgi:tryptophan synthase, alpha subunit|uniref:tryptophan synthase n=1 Tax=bioreactor metagenome TaxID=1076179 RepID=A0A644VKZ8_9ZZZZ|nr:tryptophan synthase subunit alpha [Acidaminococcaceae bacterium]NLU44419.1 tryptophan synthase subunit alpha [Acholeplasmataceae bacterium]
MNKIAEVFAKEKKVFIPFITAGDPSLEKTEEMIYAMEKAGAGIIEIGIPFSDPVAEGPVIQEADLRALAAGCKTDKIFAMLKRVRQNTKVPLVFLTYINPIFTYGCDKFFKNCRDCDINGVIIPDVPFEEKGEVAEYCKKYEVDLISLIAPTSEQRIKMIARDAAGYIYLVSSLGVTGVRTTITTDIGAIVEQIRQVTKVPIAVGFGIATPEQAEKMAKISDGAIVGSAIVKIVAANGDNCVKPVADYVRTMVEAVATCR